MAAKQATATRNRWFWVIPTTVAVLISNVVIHILYMIVYGYLINPGQDTAHYQSHAELSAPYSSIVFGMPLMFLAGRWVGRKFAAQQSVTAALLVWLVYFLIDITVVVFAGEFSWRLVIIFVISFATKFAAAYLGGLAARKRIIAE